MSKVKTATTITIIGVLLFLAGIVTAEIGGSEFSNWQLFAYILMKLGFLLSAFGIVRLIIVSKYKMPIIQIVAASAITLLSISMTLSHIKGDIAGIYTIGFIPIPTIVVTLLGTIGGIYLFISGIRKLRQV